MRAQVRERIRTTKIRTSKVENDFFNYSLVPKRHFS